MLKTSEIRQLSDNELHQELDKTVRELTKLRLDLQGGYSKETAQLKSKKKYIARMETLVQERKSEAKDQ